MEPSIQGIILTKYSGSLSEMTSYLNIVMQASGVLIGGIVIWRASAQLHKKKMAKRSRNKFFETTYSKGWKRK